MQCIFTILFLGAVLVGCGDQVSAPFNQEAFSTKHLYIATGACYGGGVVTSPGPSNIVARFDLQTGQLLADVIDYNSFSPGDSPVSISDYSEDEMLVLVENTAGRRIDRVRKDGSGAAVHIINATALSAVLRTFIRLSDFSILVSKSTAVEKFNSAKSRVLIGAAPWVSAPAGACAASATLISSIAAFPNGKILYAHAAATPNNRIGLISASGYAAAGDCLAVQAGPTTTALPTRVLIHSSGRTLVSFGSTTAASNTIYSYNVNSTANTITAPVAAWTDFSVVNGPSAMVEDPSNGNVLISSATSTFNTVERFSYNSTTNTLSRVGAAPFMTPSIHTRCITDMKVMP
ncbi:MAG: hypothetical protein AB7N80_07320 [Bdellovibrionales bacterium]